MLGLHMISFFFAGMRLTNQSETSSHVASCCRVVPKPCWVTGFPDSSPPSQELGGFSFGCSLFLHHGTFPVTPQSLVFVFCSLVLVALGFPFPHDPQNQDSENTRRLSEQRSNALRRCFGIATRSASWSMFCMHTSCKGLPSDFCSFHSENKCSLPRASECQAMVLSTHFVKSKHSFNPSPPQPVSYLPLAPVLKSCYN